MTLPAVGQAAYPTPEEILASLLTSVRYSYAQHGLTANVLKGSDNYYRLKAYADVVAVAIANNKIALDQFSPLKATGEDLVTLAGIFGVVKRPASKSTGGVFVFGTNLVTVTIPAGYKATAPNGAKYETVAVSTPTLSGSTKNGTTPTVQLRSTLTGRSTRQVAGTKLTWDSAAIGYLLPTCTVDDGEIDGGSDADDDEVLRARLLRRLQNPSFGGNASHVAEWAEASTAAVGAAYVYSAARGPGSYDVAVTGSGGDRTLSAATVAVVASYVNGQHPGHADVNVTSVVEEEIDVVVNLKLPLPVSAGGAGGGWKDATPWPSDEDSSVVGVPVKVTVNGTTTITVNSTSADPPVAGRRFAIWNPDDETFTEFTVKTVGGVSGAYTIAPTCYSYPAWVVAGMYVSAAASNLQLYGTDFSATATGLGPGEKTTNPDLLPRAKRHPRTDTSAPSDLTEIQLGVVANQHAEVLGVSYAARYDTGLTTTRKSPSIPTTAADPPNILTLKHLAFRYEA